MMRMNSLRAAILAVCCVAGQGAHAQLFGDDQARQAILDLRQRFDQSVAAQNRLVDENAQMRRGMLDLQQQIESLRGDLARSRGQEEQLTRDIADLKKAQADNQRTLDDHLKKMETPSAGASAEAPTSNAGGTVTSEGSPNEKQEYDAALAQFRAGDFAGAQSGFAAFIKRYPRSALAPTALLWLGNAQYATRNYKEAITNFRSLLTAAPNHPRARAPLLSIANCQSAVKDTRAARTTLESLIKTYPQSEAAHAGKERLARLK